ncbi:MAG: Vacuolar protease A [Trichoglossum hirsutum]|nr:MAG: Vacuolar protease A [Trichoglossum hirsutum]
MRAVSLAIPVLFVIGIQAASFRAPVYSQVRLKPQCAQKSLGDQDSRPRSPHANPITNFANVQFFTNIGIGNPPQLFRSLIDLSWSDLFVPSSRCRSEACMGHYNYDSSWSSTYLANNTRTRLRYTGLRAEGHMSQDTLYVAGLEIRNQLFHELSIVKRDPTVLWTPDFDAVLGLAPGNDASLQRVLNPFQMMVSQGLLDSNVVSLSLGGTVAGDRSIPGEITYGGINTALFDGDLIRIPLTKVTDPDHGPQNPIVTGPPLLNGTWQVEARGVSWGDSEDEYRDLHGFTARVDSANPFIYLPQDTWRKLNAVIQPEHIPWFTESIDCMRRDKLPSLTFNLGGHNFTLTAYEYTLEMMMGDYGIRCVSGIQPWQKQAADEKDIILLGSAFLRGFYGVFDFDHQELGCESTSPLLDSPQASDFFNTPPSSRDFRLETWG